MCSVIMMMVMIIELIPMMICNYYDNDKVNQLVLVVEVLCIIIYNNDFDMT